MMLVYDKRADQFCEQPLSHDAAGEQPSERMVLTTSTQLQQADGVRADSDFTRPSTGSARQLARS